MRPGQAKSLGMTLGLLFLILVPLYVLRTYQQGTTNWFLLVMFFGMILLIFYTISGSRRRRR